MSTPQRLGAIATALAAISAMAGLGWSVALYGPEPAMIAAFRGQDAVTLLVAVPLLVASLRETHRGSLRGTLMLSGGLAYLTYAHCFQVVGARFAPVFPLHLAIVGTSGFALVLLLARLDVADVRWRLAPTLPAGRIGGLLVAWGALFAAGWLTLIGIRLVDGVPLTRVERTVFALDLGIVLPATIAVGMGLIRRRAWGFAFAGAPLILTAVVMAGLVAGNVITAMQGLPIKPFDALTAVAALVLSTAATVSYLHAAPREPTYGERGQAWFAHAVRGRLG